MLRDGLFGRNSLLADLPFGRSIWPKHLADEFGRRICRRICRRIWPTHLADATVIQQLIGRQVFKCFVSTKCLSAERRSIKRRGTAPGYIVGYEEKPFFGATTLSIITFSITTFSIMTFSSDTYHNCTQQNYT
jgi:hypothetical protein